MKHIYRINYPKELEGQFTISNKRDRYNALQAFTINNYARISFTINKKIFDACPEIKTHISEREFQGFIDEIVKNIFDSVNSAKVNNHERNSIEIKFTLTISHEKIQIRISDNGSGFDHLEKSKATSLSDYLKSRNKHSSLWFINSNENKINSQGIQSNKASEKKLGKNYLLGDQGIGLSTMNKCIKKLGGLIKIKNRKEKGASIEINLPHVANTNEIAGNIILINHDDNKRIIKILDYIELTEPLIQAHAQHKGHGSI